MAAEGTGETHEAVKESDNVAVANDLEDIDLALEVVQQLARQLLPRDGLDGNMRLRLLMIGVSSPIALIVEMEMGKERPKRD